ncbi:MAG: hypothetical protein ACK561_04455 [Pseudomonadaceae bacterium]
MNKATVCAASSVAALSVLLGRLQEAEAIAARELQEAQERHLKAQQARDATWHRYLLANLENAHQGALIKADACQEQRGQHLREAERASKVLAILLGQPDTLKATV